MYVSIRGTLTHLFDFVASDVLKKYVRYVGRLKKLSEYLKKVYMHKWVLLHKTRM